jgi:predicted RNA binding protein YcfA (HicA-like mRNA interferase family)
LPNDFYRELARLLADAGWSKAEGGKGSHEKWIEAKSGKIVIVPRSKSRHTANEVLKQAGLPKAF